MSQGVEEYRELRELLNSADAFERDWLVSMALVLAPVALLVICIALFAAPQLRSLAVLNAFFFAFTSVQLGFVMHDAGHSSLFQRRWANDLAGLIAGNLLAGLSYGWWVSNHNSHHAHPNVEAADPDLAMIRIVFALLPQDLAGASAFRRYLGRHQVLFAPLLFTLQIFGLKYFSLRYLLTGRSRFRAIELALIATHHFLYFWILFHFLDLRLGIVVVLIHHLAAGLYLTTVVSPNHIARPLLATQEPNVLLRQIAASRNISTPRALEFLWGGLNYQIEHHLFPAVRRDRIRDLLPVVRRFCAERNIPYHETSLIEGYGEIFHLLSKAGLAA